MSPTAESTPSAVAARASRRSGGAHHGALSPAGCRKVCRTRGAKTNPKYGTASSYSTTSVTAPSGSSVTVRWYDTNGPPA